MPVDRESSARCPQGQSLEEQRGWRPQWGGRPTLPPSFSLRAFYLERSNLPTDASTTAVKIDQVCPTSPHPAAELGQSWGLLGPHRSPNPGRDALEASGVAPAGRSLLGELLPHSGVPPSSVPALQLLRWLSPCWHLLPRAFLLPLGYPSVSLKQAHTRGGHVAFFLFDWNLLPTFENQKLSSEMEASGFSGEAEGSGRPRAHIPTWHSWLSTGMCSRPFTPFPGSDRPRI